MDLSKIEKIEGLKRIKVPPPQLSVNIKPIKVVEEPKVIKSIPYSAYDNIYNILKVERKKEIPSVLSPVIVFNEEVNKRITELKNKIEALHKVASTGNYNDLINKPDIEILILETKQELEDMLEPLNTNLINLLNLLDTLKESFSQSVTDNDENFKLINLDIKLLLELLSLVHDSYNNLKKSVENLENLNADIESIFSTLENVLSTITTNIETINNLLLEVQTRVEELVQTLTIIQEKLDLLLEDFELQLDQKLLNLQNSLQTEITDSVSSVNLKVELYKQDSDKTINDLLPLIYAAL